jgi:hypothetical protein
MSTDLGFVAHAAERHANELAAGGTRHRLAERGLADARGADQAQDRGLDLVNALLHGQVLEDAVLDLLEPVVILVQHVRRVAEVVLDLGLLGPRQADQRVEVVAHHRRLGRHRRHQLELLQLVVGLLARFLGHARGLDLLFQFLEVGTFFAVAEFLLDRLDLLVEVVLALALLHLALDAATDALFHLQDVDFVLEQLQQLFQALGDVEQVEDGLLGFELERQVRRDRVGQATRIVDARDGRQDLGRDLLVQLDVLVELLRDGAAQRLDFRRRFGLRRDGHGLGDEVLSVVADFLGRRALDAFDQHLHGAVGQLQHLQDARDTTDLEHVVCTGLVLAGGLLGHEHDLATGFHRRFQCLDGLGAADEQRDHHMREHDDVAQREQRERDRLGRQDRMSRHGGKPLFLVPRCGPRIQLQDANPMLRHNRRTCSEIRRWLWPVLDRPAAVSRFLR